MQRLNFRKIFARRLALARDVEDAGIPLPPQLQASIDSPRKDRFGMMTEEQLWKGWLEDVKPELAEKMKEREWRVGGEISDDEGY